jgi:hypothetical protein
MLLLTASLSLTGFAGDSGSATTPRSTHVRLNTDSASRLAASLANKNARQFYNVAPFTQSQGTLRFVHGRWQWEAIAGYGTGDLLATVSFSPDGSKSTVTVQTLVLLDLVQLENF